MPCKALNYKSFILLSIQMIYESGRFQGLQMNVTKISILVSKEEQEKEKEGKE